MAASVPSAPTAWHPRAVAASIPPAWRRRLRIAAIAAAVLLALYSAVGFLAVPWIAKRQIESLAASQLGREAKVGDVRFNPFTLRGRVTDSHLADRVQGRTLLAFDALEVDVSPASLVKRALVLDGVRVAHPRLHLALDAQGRSNVQDIFDRAAAQPPAGDRSAFALSNIEIQDASLVFEDAVRGHRTEVTHLNLGIPFLSSRAGDAPIRVRPHLEARIDGAPFALTGTTSEPFQDTQRATLDINLDALPLPRYAVYAPLPSGLRLAGGALTTRLALSFVTWKGTPRGILLYGNARLDTLAVTREDESALFGAKSIEVRLAKADLLNREVALERLAVTAPQADLRRMADGSLELQKLLSSPGSVPSKDPAAAPEAAQAAWKWSVARVDVADGEVSVVDRSVTPAFETRLAALEVKGAGVASDAQAADVELAFATRDGARFKSAATVNVPAQAVRGHFALDGLPLASLHPYYAAALAIDVRRGKFDAAGDFDVAGVPLRFSLAQGSAAVSDLDVAVRGERDALARIASAGAKGIAVDLARRTVTVESVEARGGALRLLRDEDGAMHFQRAVRPASASQGPAPPGTTKEAAWHVVVQRLALDRFAADFEDRSTQPVVKLKVADARLAAENLDTAPGARASGDLAARVGARGRVRVKASASAQPLAADAVIQTSAFDLVPLRPYYESRTNVIVTSGEVNARGRLTYAARDGAMPQVRYVGNVVVNDFGSLDRPASQELVRWKTLAVTTADVSTEPLRVSLGAVALDGFYARLILDAEGKLNVLRLLASPAETSQPPQAAPPPAEAASAPVSEGNEIPAVVGRVQLTNGEVEFSDFYIKPNYSAHLTDLNGSVSRIAANQDGTVEVAARLDGSAPVDIRGTLNPFARRLALDVAAKASDVDLPSLTPYSVKYAGYGIEKGKLSMEVHYRVEDRKLEATNKIVLDQLTFGEHVDSPTATRLPVLLAVKLLQDRDGVIRLDLPISGTLDDPKFSMWRVVLQIIGNLLTKAATAPFALLGALLPGGGEQLAFVEFAPGQARLTPAAEAKLATLAKALLERPGLRLDATGRAIPETDAEALRRAALERALRIAKQKALAEAGESAPRLEEIAIDASDHAKYLKGVYRSTDLPDKPRNFIGMQKDIPQAEMEQRLLAGYKIDENALRELAGHRAQAVKDWLTTKGNIPAERVFVVSPKLSAEGVQGGGAPTRVDFAIK